MATDSYYFDQFVLDCGDRQLLRAGERVDLNSRYFDALRLLVREQGRLVSKDRFLDEVWRGVPVTEEALTQCIRMLRRQLGDDVSRPRFIETVPKHGYRFIASVDQHDGSARPLPRDARDWRRVAMMAAAATVGGGMAGFIGGLVYGFAAASSPEIGRGAMSMLLVVQCLSIIVGLMGGAGVGTGIAVAGLSDWRRTALGGAAGGLVVGAGVKLLGIDAFHLLIGEAPAGITGGIEGMLLGAACGLGASVAVRDGMSLRRGVGFAAGIGTVAGIMITLIGGRLMGGSLELLARTFPASRLRLDGLTAVFGGATQLVTGALEGGLFVACIAGALRLMAPSVRGL